MLAEALAQYGADSDLAPALAVLRTLAPPEKNGVFIAMSALSAIEALLRGDEEPDFGGEREKNSPS